MSCVAQSAKQLQGRFDEAEDPNNYEEESEPGSEDIDEEEEDVPQARGWPHCPFLACSSHSARGPSQLLLSRFAAFIGYAVRVPCLGPERRSWFLYIGCGTEGIGRISI